MIVEIFYLQQQFYKNRDRQLRFDHIGRFDREATEIKMAFELAEENIYSPANFLISAVGLH